MSWAQLRHPNGLPNLDKWSARGAHSSWDNSKPFPFFILHGLFAPELVAAAHDEYPAPDDTGWHTFDGPLEEGKQEGSIDRGGDATRTIHDFFHTFSWVEWLQVATGHDLTTDPKRLGAGLHQSCSGARLGVHVDFNVHPDSGWYRRVNLILYLTAGWEREWGGALELHHDEPLSLDGQTGVAQSIKPEANTLVIFEASDRSWHGHPVPISDGAPCRRSMPAYYYTPMRDDDPPAHSTIFRGAA